jgi:2-phosphoglycerate kinase
MLYLVGGSPRCGKTTFSKMLAKKKRIPWFSTDLVATIVFPYIPKKEKAKKLPELNVCVASPKLLLQAEIQNAKTLWPGVQRLLFALSMNRHDAVIEGVHLFPDFIHELETMKEWEFIRKDIRSVFLIKKDEQKIIEGFKKSDKSSDWLLQCIKTEADMHNAAKMVQIKSIYLEKQANKYGYRVVNTENDFQKTLKQLLKES